MKIIEKKTSELVPYANNPRHNNDAVDFVAESIKNFGFKVPIVIDNKNEVVAGHTRLKAAIKLQLEKVPCLVADDLTPEQIKAFRVADNKVGEIASWDEELLEAELSDLAYSGIDMSVYGFGEYDSEPDELDNIVEDIVPEPPAEPITKVGDIWQLGKHRLICGDSTDNAVVAKLMGDIKADLILTDPPYNVDYENKIDMVHRWRKTVSTKHGVSGKSKRLDNGKGLTDIKNDKMSDSEFLEFLQAAFTVMAEHTRAGGAAYVFHSGAKSIEFMTAFMDNLKYKQTLIWSKPHFVLSKLPYHYKHEPILFGYKDGGKKYFIDSRSESTVIEDKGVDYKKLNKAELLKYVEKLTQDTKPTTVLNEQIVQSCEVHPTMKPIKLLARLIRDSSRQGEVVLDSFGGSGSTLIACEQLGRACCMCELDPRYVDVAVDRWEKLTGQKAVLVNNDKGG